MIFFACLLFLLSVSALGYLVLLFLPTVSRQPLLPLSFALGGGLITWQLFVIRFFAQLTLNRWSLVLVLLEILILSFIHYRQSNLVWPQFSWHKFNNSLSKFLVSLICLVLLLSLIRVATNPLITFDALVVWAHRVQILVYRQADLFNADTISFWAQLAKPNYPWHLSLLAWFQTQFTGLSNTWINFLPWCYYSLLLLTLYHLAKDKLSQLWSLSLVLAVAIMPLIFYHSYNFYADLPLAFYLALIALVWRRWLVLNSTTDLYLVAILSGLALHVKSEAVFFVATLACLTLIKNFKTCSIIKSLLPFSLTAILYAPWFIWMKLHHLGLNNVGGGLAWHGEVTGAIFSGAFVAASWQLWFYLLGLVIVMAWTGLTKQRLFIYSGLWFIGNLMIFFALYYFTPAYQYVLDNSALSRNFILLIPLSFALLVDSLAAWFKQS